jgi:hypothetical protein
MHIVEHVEGVWGKRCSSWKVYNTRFMYKYVRIKFSLLMTIMIKRRMFGFYMQQQTITASIYCSTELTCKLSRKMDIIMVSPVSHNFSTQGTSVSHITSNHTFKNFSLAPWSKLWNKRNSYYAHYGFLIDANQEHWLVIRMRLINKCIYIGYKAYIMKAYVRVQNSFSWESYSPSRL